MEKLSGFISSDGARVLSQQELKQADAKLSAKKTEAQTPSPESDSVEANVTNALGLVKSRSFQDVNELGNKVQDAKTDVRDAKKQIRKEARVLKKLATALENGSDKKAEKLTAEFNKLEESRTQLSERIDDNNLERGARTPVRLGNKTLSNVTVDRVKLEDSIEVDLKDAESVRAARKDLLSGERRELKAQNKELNGELRKLRQSNREINSTIEGLIENDTTEQAKARDAFSSFEEAESLTKDLGSRISSLGESSLGFNKLDSDTVDALISA